MLTPPSSTSTLTYTPRCSYYSVEQVMCVAITTTPYACVAFLFPNEHTTTNHSILPLQFYVAESCLEVFARHMLFLTLLFEPTDKLGLQGMYVGYWKISYYVHVVVTNTP